MSKIEKYFQPAGYLVDAAPADAESREWLVREHGANGPVVFGPFAGKQGFYDCRTYINKKSGFIFYR